MNYEARAKGVTRQMRGDDAREKCPDIVLVHVPESREKADLTKYRRAGREVIEVLLASGAVVERASIDEAYLDLTKVVENRLKVRERVEGSQVANTHLGGGKGEERAQMMQEWLEEIQEEGGNPGDIRLAVGAAIVEEIRAEVFTKTSFRCSAGDPGRWALEEHSRFHQSFACCAKYNLAEATRLENNGFSTGLVWRLNKSS